MISLIEKAARLAVEAHDGQTYKTDDAPYIVHPFSIALFLARHGFSDTVIAAALVHDVLEDTDVGEDEMTRTLGPEVVTIVKTVSEDATLPWEERKQKYVEAVRSGSVEAKAVSLADKINNLERLISRHHMQGPAVWSHFNRGKEDKLWFDANMLAMFKETWDHPLIAQYEHLLQEAEALED